MVTSWRSRSAETFLEERLAGEAVAPLTLDGFEDAVRDRPGVDGALFGVEFVGQHVAAGAVGPPATGTVAVAGAVRRGDDARYLGVALPVGSLAAVQRERAQRPAVERALEAERPVAAGGVADLDGVLDGLRAGVRQEHRVHAVLARVVDQPLHQLGRAGELGGLWRPAAAGVEVLAGHLQRVHEVELLGAIHHLGVVVPQRGGGDVAGEIEQHVPVDVDAEGPRRVLGDVPDEVVDVGRRRRVVAVVLGPLSRPVAGHRGNRRLCRLAVHEAGSGHCHVNSSLCSRNDCLSAP
jgi:hypothetical protein